jgi:redox-sensitive bicupin YhaK (pirin superfamily)
MTTQAAAARSVARVIESVRTREGAGFPVRRPFPTHTLDAFDPFLLLDEMGPVDYPPGAAKGAPDHPHRGFETVTYLLEGGMVHRDSHGQRGTLGPGDVQWMTAGAGVIHSEMPEAELLARGGRMHGFQLWVNLPGRDKMIRPRYQDVPSARIPVVTSADGKARVKVIAGEAMGARAVTDTRTPIMYLHYTLQPGASVAQRVPADYNAFAYVVGGRGHFGAGGREAREGQMVVFGRDGDEVTLAAPADAPGPFDVLLIAGVPLGEPVARYGPFVMNTPDEIGQAFEDFRAGRFGEIPAETR